MTIMMRMAAITK